MFYLNYIFIIILFNQLYQNSYSFKKINIPSPLTHINKINMSPRNMLDILTSLEEYTIITDGEKNKDLYELMQKNKMNVYYIDINNLLEKKELLNYLKTKYSYLDNSDDLWIFSKGFLYGSRKIMEDFIKNNK
jgi:hypothetical protein